MRKSAIYRRIGTFLVLAFGFSSIFYALIITSSESYMQWVMPLMLCPGIAAILTKLIFDRHLSGLGWKLGSLKWLGVAYIIPILYSIIIYGVAWLIGLGDYNTAFVSEIATQYGIGARPAWQILGGYILVISTMSYFIFGLLSSFGEELGWRGFLYPYLHQLFGYTRASLMIGFIWWLYHVPIMLFSDYNTGAPVAYSAVMFLLAITLIGFIFNWIRMKTGSVWGAVLLHTSHNIFLINLFDPMLTRTRWTDYIVTEFGFGIVIVGGLFALYFWSRRAEVASTQVESPTTFDAEQHAEFQQLTQH